MYHRVFSTHLEQVVLALHTAQLIVNGGYKKSEPKKVSLHYPQRLDGAIQAWVRNKRELYLLEVFDLS